MSPTQRRDGDPVTVPTDADVPAFLAAVAHPVRRRDGERLLTLMTEVTGQTPHLWGPSIVGFGTYHYHYASGRQGDAPAAAFSPRARATTIYLMDGLEPHADALERLGRHSGGRGCLYLPDLAEVDLDVLTGIVRASYTTLTSGTVREHLA
jgi:hypothetical protein